MGCCKRLSTYNLQRAQQRGVGTVEMHISPLPQRENNTVYCLHLTCKGADCGGPAQPHPTQGSPPQPPSCLQHLWAPWGPRQPSLASSWECLSRTGFWVQESLDEISMPLNMLSVVQNQLRQIRGAGRTTVWIRHSERSAENCQQFITPFVLFPK